jgi:hypothetical protein
MLSESVLIIKDFGLQLSRKNVFGAEYKRVIANILHSVFMVFISVYLMQFLDREKISRVFIHEYIEGSSIRYCLAFLIHGDSKLELCYRYAYPGLPALQKIFSMCSEEVWKESKSHHRSKFR